MENKDIIKNAMKKKGIKTIKELSIITGVSQASLYDLTSKDYRKLGKRVGEKLNRILDIDLDYRDKDKEDVNSLGYKIFKLRSICNWSVEQLSMITNVSLDTLHKIEQNKQSPNKRTLKKIAEAFGIQEYELINK